MQKKFLYIFAFLLMIMIFFFYLQKKIKKPTQQKRDVVILKPIEIKTEPDITPILLPGFKPIQQIKQPIQPIQQPIIIPNCPPGKS